MKRKRANKVSMVYTEYFSAVRVKGSFTLYSLDECCIFRYRNKINTFCISNPNSEQNRIIKLKFSTHWGKIATGPSSMRTLKSCNKNKTQFIRNDLVQESITYCCSKVSERCFLHIGTILQRKQTRVMGYALLLWNEFEDSLSCNAHYHGQQCKLKSIWTILEHCISMYSYYGKHQPWFEPGTCR